MRRARPTLAALLLLLALAPAASAHDESDPNHRDTPADLAAADIDHTLALAHLGRTVAPDDDAEFLRQLREDAAQDERIRRMEQELAELDADEPHTDGGTGEAGGTAGGKTPGRTPGATSGDALGSGDTLGTERKRPDAPDAPGTPGEAGPSGRPNG